MLLDFNKLIVDFDAKPNGVINVGSHFGEEYDAFVNAGIKRMVFIEPCKAAFSVLSEKMRGKGNVQLFNVACGSVKGTRTMYTGDNTVNKGQSNSLLEPDLHLVLHKEVEFTDTEIVDMVRLDDLELIGKGYDLLVLDCQGTEDLVLSGGMATLKHINWVYTEVNRGSVYKNCAQIDKIDELLSEFERVVTGPWVGGLWTDAWYVRKSKLIS